MILQDGQNRTDVEMCEVNRVGYSVVERGGTIFEQSHHFGVDRTKDDQSSSHLIGLGSQSIDTRLQI